MGTPKVSAIILTYNRPLLLQRAIASILGQSFQDFEIIVVDDGSREDSGPMIRRFNDPRITYIRHATNIGEPQSRNEGLRLAKGEYIGFLDDDDQWLEGKLARQVELLDAAPASVAAVYTGTQDVDLATGDLVRRRIPVFRGDILAAVFRDNFLSVSSVLVRSRCYELCGMFDESISAGNDFDMWLRIAAQFDFEYISDILVEHGIHQGRRTDNSLLQINSRKRMLEKYRHFHPKYLEYIVFSMAMLYLLRGESGPARRACFTYLRSNPLSARTCLAIILSLIGSHNVSRIMQMRANSARAALPCNG